MVVPPVNRRLVSLFRASQEPRVKRQVRNLSVGPAKCDRRGSPGRRSSGCLNGSISAAIIGAGVNHDCPTAARTGAVLAIHVAAAPSPRNRRERDERDLPGQTGRRPGETRRLFERRRGVSRRRRPAHAGQDSQPASRLQVHGALLGRSRRHDQSEGVEIPVESRRARHRGRHRDAAALPRLARRGHGALRQAAASRKAHRRAAHQHARIQRAAQGRPVGDVELQQSGRIRETRARRDMAHPLGPAQGGSDARRDRAGAARTTRSCAASRISSATPTSTKPIRRQTQPSWSGAWSCRRWRRTPRRRTTRRRARPTNSSKASTIRRCRSCGRA